MASRIKNTRILSREPERFGYFFPFNDAILETDFNNAFRVGLVPITSGQINTKAFDQYRQGIEITGEQFRFLGTGPKIWAGNTDGYTNVQTIGQMLSFVEFENTKIFEERINYDPVLYISNSQYQEQELIFNDGPQQNKEPRIDVFSSPYLKGLDSNEANNNAHDVRASLEDGNPQWGYIQEKNSRIEQMFDFRDHTLPPFLESGERIFGEVPIIKLSNDANTVVLHHFNDSIIDENAYVNLFTSSNAPIFQGGPGYNFIYNKGFKSLATKNLNYGPVLLSTTNNLNIQQLDLTVQALVYIPSILFEDESELEYLTIGMVSSASFGFMGTDLIDRNWEFRLVRKNSSIPWDAHIEYADTKYYSLFSSVINTFDISGPNLENNINLNGWNHLAFTRNSNTTQDPLTYAYDIKLYLNGIKLTEGSGLHHEAIEGDPNFVYSVNGQDGLVNNIRPYSFAFNGGKLASVKISNIVLSDSDISSSAASVLPYMNLQMPITGVFLPGYIQSNYPPLSVYSDSAEDLLISNISSYNTSSYNSDLLSILTNSSMSINLDDDIRGRYDMKSMPAGNDSYGPSQAMYGTDSIAYSGYHRGS
jgi:hypothetical protein